MHTVNIYRVVLLDFFIMDSIQKFIRFLKENDVYIQYISNFNKYKLNKEFCNVKQFLQNKDSNCWIIGSFTWYKTPQGDDFWYDLDMEWDLMLKWWKVKKNLFGS